jgi:hypothetical protein
MYIAPPALQVAHKYDLSRFQTSLAFISFPFALFSQFPFINFHYLKKVNTNQVNSLSYTSVKCSLNKLCKNGYLKSKINELLINVNKIIFEGYLLANLHIIWLLDKDREIPPLNQKFFKMFWHKSMYFFIERKCHVMIRSWLLPLKNTARLFDLWDTNPGVEITLIPLWETVVW